VSRVGRAGAVAAALLGTALLGPALAACSPDAAPRAPAPVTSGWPGCRTIGAFADPGGGVPPYPAGAVPAGFVPQRAVLCQTTTRDGTGGSRTVDLERTATDIDPLLTYLDQPDEPPTDGACTADGWVEPWLFLLDSAGRFVRPAIPVDECGKPLGRGSDPDRTPWLTLAYTDLER
jgi:hypothetical protein